MKKFNLFIILSAILISSSSCNTDYNTDFEPPVLNPKYTDVYPETIIEQTAKVEGISSNMKGVEGYSAMYGENIIIISAYQTPSKEIADNYFKEYIVPVFDAMSTHSRGNINGRWYASGKEGKKKAYGWVNSNWIFVITAEGEDNFNAAVNAFNYISLK